MKIIINDETGFLAYGSLMSEDQSQILFKQLLQIPTERESIVLFGKKVTPNRFIAYYGDPGKIYHYSGRVAAARSWIPLLEGLREATSTYIESELKQRIKFNYMILNSYPDFSSTIGWHRDKEVDNIPGHTIASLSFGATREFLVEGYSEKGKLRLENGMLSFELKSGEIILMAGDLQKNYKHCISGRKYPLTPDNDQHRINLTFRQLK